MAQVYGGRWQVVEPLGEGGQAHTFLVSDLRGEGDTRYVLKRLKNSNRIGRFKREIEAVRMLIHENIVHLIDFDLDAQKPYLVTEFCSGGSLAQADPFWRRSSIQAFRIFQEVCQGLAYAHSKGIVHRDIKPDNIFLRASEGPAVIGDFGVCHLEDDGMTLTLTEEAVGPRLFIAPELEDGKASEVSPKSDTYSLGKLLYWLLSEGKTFSREKHRDPKWDLKGRNEDSLLGWNNVYMEHVNRLLDLMICHDPRDRRGIDNILILAKRTAKLVEKEYNPIASNIKQLCTYCGSGWYVVRAKENIEVRNFGFEVVGNPDWRILVCNNCGHVQSFRVDYASRKDWWK